MNTIDKVIHLEAHEHPAESGGDNLGAILVAAGKISPQDASRVMELQQREGWRFGEAALRLSLISERDLIHALHKQYDLPQLVQGSGSLGKDLVTAYQQYHPRTEELRALRTQLLIRWYRQPGIDQHVLAVVSPGSGEGRSYIAANLAVLFSQLGERTLLIDADLRNPRQNRIFNVADRVGLSSILAGRTGPEAIVGIPGLHNLMLLPAGAPPPNPLELLSRAQLPTLFTDYLADFDIIIVDTPPALRYSDAQTICFRTGNAIVLARRDRTRQADASRVVDDLKNIGTNVIGTVINSH